MINIVTIRHLGSDIIQSIAILRGEFYFRATPPASWAEMGEGPSVRRVSEEEARDTLLIWRELAADGDLRIEAEHELLLESKFGAPHLEMLVGEAPDQCPPDEGPEAFALENASPAAPYCPEAQADLELHEELHPAGYGLERGEGA